MKDALYERVKILEENDVISHKVADYTRRVIDRLLEEIPNLTQDKVEMFITHLAMAGKRAEEGEWETPIDSEILAAVKAETIFPKAIQLRDSLLSGTDIVFPEAEKDFLSVHICNLLNQEG